MACSNIECFIVKAVCHWVSDILLIFFVLYSSFSDLEALKNFRNQLTVYEQKEIFNYTELWFLGLEAKKIEGLPETQNNNCYDDEHGSYLKVSKWKNYGFHFQLNKFAVTVCQHLSDLCEINVVSRR